MALKKPREDITEDSAVVSQVKASFKPHNRLATMMGFLLGGFVPIASYVVAHYEVSRTVEVWAQLSSYLVLGGLVYSATTVYAWGTMAFRSGVKATGFVVLLEGH